MDDKEFSTFMAKVKEDYYDGYFYDYGRAKLAQDSEVVEYISPSTTENQACGNCRYWSYEREVPQGDCNLVKGNIENRAWCKLWEPIKILESKEETLDAGEQKVRKVVEAVLDRPQVSVSRFIESPLLDPTGKEWTIRIIDEGTSLNNNHYPLDVLHEGLSVFSNVPVHAAIGPDHSEFERGVASIVGFIKDPIAVPEGINATFHVSDPDTQVLLLDLYNEGVLDEFMGFSIAAASDYKIEGGKRIATKLLEDDKTSVDLVRNPAAGGKFIKVTESNQGDNGMTMISEERIAELIADGIAAAAKASAESHEDETDEEKEVRIARELEEAAHPTADMDDKAKKAKAKADAEKKTKESVLQVTDGEKRLNLRVLSSMLVESKLPDVSVKRLKETYKTGDFDFDNVEEAIKSEKAYLASLETVHTERLTAEGNGRVVLDENDKLLARIDAMFDVSEDKDGNNGHEGGYITIQSSEGKDEKIRAFRSFKEAFCAWTGASPFEVDGPTLWREFARPIQGYDSGDLIQKGKLYEALQQSDWSNVIIDRLHNALLQNYQNLPQYEDWRKIARVIPVSDYQPWRDTKIGGYANLPVVAERGTYGELTHPSDEQTSATMAKHGGIASQITRELIINDQIGAVSQIPFELARSAKRTLYEAVFDVLISNAEYGPDTTALFDAGHNNTGTTALSIAGTDVAQIAMRDQTKFGSTADILGAANTPRIWVGPNELQGLANRLFNPGVQTIGQISADADTDQDILRFKGQMEVVVLDYHTDATEHYFVASPADVAGIGVLFLDGREEPEIFIQSDERVGEMFSQDVENIKVRHEWQTVLRDFRPFYRST